MKTYKINKYFQDCNKFIGHKPCAEQVKGGNCFCCSSYSDIKRILLCCFGAYGECLIITSQIKALESLGYVVDVATTRAMSAVFSEFKKDPDTIIIDSIDWVKASHRKYDLVLSIEKDSRACSLLTHYLKQKNCTRYAFFGYESGAYVICCSSYGAYKMMLNEFNIGQDNQKFIEAPLREYRIKKIYNELLINLDGHCLDIGVSALPKLVGCGVGIMLNTGGSFGGPNCRVPCVDNFVKLFEKVRKPKKIFLLGGVSEIKKNMFFEKEIKSRAKRHCVINTTKNSVPSYSTLFKIINNVKVVITPDTLVRHIARATGKKLFTLMSSTKNADFVATDNETLVKNFGNKACQCLGHSLHKCWSNDKWINKVII